MTACHACGHPAGDGAFCQRCGAYLAGRRRPRDGSVGGGDATRSPDLVDPDAPTDPGARDPAQAATTRMAPLPSTSARSPGGARPGGASAPRGVPAAGVPAASARTAPDAATTAGPRCPACGRANPDGRTFCGACGTQLVDAPPSAGRRSHRRRRGASVALAVLVIAAAVATAVVLAVRPDGAGDPQVAAAPSAGPSDVASAAPAAPLDGPGDVPASAIEAAASSTLDPAGDVRYDAELTLDGDPTTAWNDGVAGPGLGEWLEWRFETPVHVSSIVVVNGYDKVDAETGADRFEQNARIANALLTTDTEERAVRLSDQREPQRLPGSLGPTCRVRLTIESVHEGDEYDDVALSEVTFLGTPDPSASCS